MRVWIENPFDTLPIEGSRPQRYWLMAQAFADAGHAVDYWTSDFNHAFKRPRVTDDVSLWPAATPRVSNGAVTLLFVPTRPYAKNVGVGRILSHRAYARTWGELAKRHARFCGKPDVIIVSSPPLSTGDVAIKLAKKYGAKLVVDMMDAWPQTFYRLLPFGLRWMGPVLLTPARLAARRALAAADLVTGVAARYGLLAREAGAREYVLAYHGVEMTSPVRREPSNRLRLAYVGSMGRTYALETVIRAVARRPETTLDLAGGGEKLEALKALAAATGCADRVRFAGHLDEDGLRTMLSACDVGIVPMSDESCVGVPYKFGDYTRAGLAIVSSLAGESEALLAEFGAGLRYLPGETDDLVARLGEVRARLAAMQAASRRLAEERFDAKRIYSGYVRRVEDLVEAGKEARR